MKKKNKTFYVQFKVDVFTTLEISAESLEEALAHAKTFKTTDVIEIPGEHIDSEVKITGVFE